MDFLLCPLVSQTVYQTFRKKMNNLRMNMHILPANCLLCKYVLQLQSS